MFPHFDAERTFSLYLSRPEPTLAKGCRSLAFSLGTHCDMDIAQIVDFEYAMTAFRF
jgi:hypothetical protein